MKFEFVEFYPVSPISKAKFSKKVIGTVHIYAIECGMDIRGILVNLCGEKMHFMIPNFPGMNPDTGEPCRYPIVSWTNPKNHKDMINFLQREVKPVIFKRLETTRDENAERKS